MTSKQPHLIPGPAPTISIGDHTITMDIARQLDIWQADRLDDFHALARISTGREEWRGYGIELIGTDKRTGALVRLYLPIVHEVYAARYDGGLDTVQAINERAAQFADYPKAVLPKGTW